MRNLAILLVMAVIFACAPQAVVSWQKTSQTEDGTKITEKLNVVPPKDSPEGGAVNFDDGELTSANTGKAHVETASSKSLARLPYLGGLLVVAGIVLFFIKAKFPFLPSELGLALGVSGVAIMLLPSAIERYLGVLLGGLALFAVIATVWRLNKTQHRVRELDPEDPTPDTHQHL